MPFVHEIMAVRMSVKWWSCCGAANFHVVLYAVCCSFEVVKCIFTRLQDITGNHWYVPALVMHVTWSEIIGNSKCRNKKK